MDRRTGPPEPRARRFRPVAVLGALAGFTVVATACSPGVGVAGPANDHAIGASAGCGRALPAGAVPPGRDESRTLGTGAGSGSFDLAVPRTYRSTRPVAVVLLFYGFGGDPAQISSLTGLPARGSNAGFLVAVPHTQKGESEWQFDGHGTDARFIDRLTGVLEATYCVDRRAVFASGFSAGAAFTIAYACAHQTQIAAIATVAVEYQLGCLRPLSILAFHGTADPLVPYQNGAVGLSLPGVKVRGTDLNMDDWARLDHCRTAHAGQHIGSQVIRQEWTGCAGGTLVTLYKVVGGGHAWPGADPKLALGLTTQQVSATQQILSFFTRASTRATT